ncbi:hypothetical protein COLO4_37524 [Corchorus olitorius]|uniref:Uncharacterized protein n=1 Tax=Corchorus olitorius TaxID=93759 RepID=A0A1R3G109_9ROSI|nr:hypothetical protein COLO4_37524 [Corchorus olitorius]
MVTEISRSPLLCTPKPSPTSILESRARNFMKQGLNRTKIFLPICLLHRRIGLASSYEFPPSFNSILTVGNLNLNLQDDCSS